MAGVSGNIADLSFAKQSAKGTPNTTYVARTDLSGGNVAPVKDVDSLQETDSSRDRGISVVRQTSAAGSPEFYVRDAFIHTILESALGAKSTSGATNYTHVLTPANSLPYLTIYRQIGNLLFEQFDDVKINELTLSADAGNELTATVDVLGRKATRLVAAATVPAKSTQVPYNMNESTVTLAGGVTALVSSFELVISNNLTVQQTDDSIPYDLAEGIREVSLGFTMIFASIDEYARFQYSAIAGTAQDTILPTITADFTFSKGANNSLQFALPAVAYEEYPVDPDPSGEAITVDARMVAQRSGSPVLTATVKNQTAT